MATSVNFPTYGFINDNLALNEENWRKFFKPFVYDSVQSGLTTSAGTGMTVNVAGGECRCGAVMGVLDGAIALDIENGHNTYDRIDLIVIQYAYGTPSTLSVAVKRGQASANPVAPTLSKVYNTLWEMEIAQVRVPAGATASSSLIITDTRVMYDSVKSLIDDNAGDGNTDVVWSADKSYDEITNLKNSTLHIDANNITIPSGTDLNTVVDTGMYYLGLNYNYINCPDSIGRRRMLFVIHISDTIIFQTLFNATDGIIYQRMGNSRTNQWLDWHSTPSIDDTKGNGDTDYVWSADKSFDEITTLKNLTLHFNGSIPKDTDLNTVVDTGIYNLGYSTNYINCPVSISHRRMLFVIYISDINVVQILFNITDGIIYQRMGVIRVGDINYGWRDWCSTLNSERYVDNIIDLNDPIETKAKLVQIKSNKSFPTDPSPLVLLHFSDLHTNATALERLIQFRDYYNAYIDDTIHTGDCVGSINSNGGIPIFNNVPGTDNILNVIGNHDTWRGSGYDTVEGWHYLTEEQSYDRYFSPFISNWGNVSIPQNKCYYKKDYVDNNVTLIVLDSMHETDDQLTWFTEALADAKTADRHVVIAAHVPLGKATIITKIDSGFNNPVIVSDHSAGEKFPSEIGSDYRTAINTFVNNGGIVVCWLAGHYHQDILGTVDNILNVLVTTSGDLGDGRTYDARVEGTKSYDAFNLVGINTYKGYLKLMRIGLDYNIVMRKVDTFCYDYINHTIISN